MKYAVKWFFGDDLRQANFEHLSLAQAFRDIVYNKYGGKITIVKFEHGAFDNADGYFEGEVRVIE